MQGTRDSPGPGVDPPPGLVGGVDDIRATWPKVPEGKGTRLRVFQGFNESSQPVHRNGSSSQGFPIPLAQPRLRHLRKALSPLLAALWRLTTEPVLEPGSQPPDPKA